MTNSKTIKVKEIQIVPFTPQEVFSVIANVEEYPDFVPYFQECAIVGGELSESEICWIQENSHLQASIILARTAIGFKAFNEAYISRIKLIPNKKVEVYSNDVRLFELLSSMWEFNEVDGNSNACEIVFVAEFGFKSSLYTKVAGYFLDYISNRQLEAFIGRLHQIHGKRR